MQQLLFQHLGAGMRHISTRFPLGAVVVREAGGRWRWESQHTLGRKSGHLSQALSPLTGQCGLPLRPRRVCASALSLSVRQCVDTPCLPALSPVSVVCVSFLGLTPVIFTGPVAMTGGHCVGCLGMLLLCLLAVLPGKFRCFSSSSVCC